MPVIGYETWLSTKSSGLALHGDAEVLVEIGEGLRIRRARERDVSEEQPLSEEILQRGAPRNRGVFQHCAPPAGRETVASCSVPRLRPDPSSSSSGECLLHSEETTTAGRPARIIAQTVDPHPPRALGRIFAPRCERGTRDRRGMPLQRPTRCRVSKAAPGAPLQRTAPISGWTSRPGQPAAGTAAAQRQRRDDGLRTALLADGRGRACTGKSAGGLGRIGRRESPFVTGL